MKKLLITLIIFAMSLSLVACTANNGQESSDVSEHSQVSDESSKDEEESSETSKEESSESSEESSENTEEQFINTLPLLEGNESFVGEFQKNEIDKIYVENLGISATVTSMVATATTASESWENEINFAYTYLMDLLEGDKKEEFELSHSAWLNDLPIVTKEIMDKYSEAGSMGKFNIAYDIMLVYRERAGAIHSQIYDINGEITYAPDEETAVG